MERGELWMVSLDSSEGHGQQMQKTVLIVTPGAFNRLTKCPVVLPVTSGGNFARTAGFAVRLAGSGTQTQGVIRCDQPRVLDLGARNAKRIETVPNAIIVDVLARVSTLFE